MTTTSTRRPVSRLPREQRMSDIMAAAFAVFCEKGYEEAAISEIAERANVVEGSIYRYFQGKRDLLVKVMGAWYESMMADYELHLAGISGTRNRLRFMIWRHLKTIYEEPAACNLIFRSLRPGEDYTATAVFEANRLYTRRTLDIVVEGIETGELRDVPLPLVRDMIYGCIEHRTWAYLRGEGHFDLDETADAIVDLVMGGLQKTPGPSDITSELAVRLERAVERLEHLQPPADPHSGR